MEVRCLSGHLIKKIVAQNVTMNFNSRFLYSGEIARKRNLRSSLFNAVYKRKSLLRSFGGHR